jgi:signal transduction histidine kinase
MIVLAALASAVLISGFPYLFPDYQPDSFLFWYDNVIYWLFPLVASLKCLHTARMLCGRERMAWLFIALGCFCMFSAEAVWTSLEFDAVGNVPVSALSTGGYALAPISFVIGILFYQDRSRAAGVSLLQAGNLGIVFSAIAFAYTLILYQVLQSVDLEPQVAITTLVEGVFVLAAPAVGLTVASRRLAGQRRAMMSIVLLGMFCITAEYFSFIYFLVNNLSAVDDPFYPLFVVASAIWFFAAYEQDQLQPEARNSEAAAALEARAKQWETLLPTFAVAGVLVVAVVFRESLNGEMLPYLSATAFVFVGSLGVRNWWGQQVETTLTEEARASEALLLTANRDLREEVLTRTRAEEELRQSQKMEALGQLTGGVAHDFNNLLSVIQANLELASLNSDGAEERNKQISNAMVAVEQGGSLTQYLLAMSRKQALKPQPIDIVDLLKHVRNGLERALGKSIKVKVSTQEGIWACLADHAQLESALLNLALNARDAMPGGGEVSISARNIAMNEQRVAEYPGVKVGDYLLIAVRDTGAGVPEADLSKVWEPFFTSKKTGEGTGLGLSTVYGFAKQSGGHVEIESELGIGAEVRIYLPRTDAPVRPVAAAEPESAPLGAGETLLLVEDDARLQGLLTQILEGLNYNVLKTADANAALSIIDANPAVEMVLSDVMLVGSVSGIELVREIHKRRPEVKALLMSGFAAEELQKAEGHNDEVELLTKPFTRTVVAYKIRAVLES